MNIHISQKLHRNKDYWAMPEVRGLYSLIKNILLREKYVKSIRRNFKKMGNAIPFSINTKEKQYNIALNIVKTYTLLVCSTGAS